MSQPTEEEIKNMSPEQTAELQKQNCIFCKIIAGDIPSKKIYEDEDFVGLLDINPAAQGHVIVLPKKHIQIMPQMSPESLAAMAKVCQFISNKLLIGFAAQGTTIFAANGMVAGQKAPHFMMHIIPRKENDGLKLNPEAKDVPEQEYDTIKKKLLTQIYGSAQPPQMQQSVPKTQVTSKEIEEKSKNKKEEEQKPVKDNNGLEESVDKTEKETLSEETKVEKTQEDVNEEEFEDDKNEEGPVDLDKIANLFK